MIESIRMTNQIVRSCEVEFSKLSEMAKRLGEATAEGMKEIAEANNRLCRVAESYE